VAALEDSLADRYFSISLWDSLWDKTKNLHADLIAPMGIASAINEM
jgi:hypothetical protein